MPIYPYCQVCPVAFGCGAIVTMGEKAAEEICNMMHRMGLKSLKARGFLRQDVVALGPAVMSNHLTLFSPVEVTDEIATHIMERAYDMYQ